MTESTATGARIPDTTSRSFYSWLGIVGPILGLAALVVFMADTSWYFVFKSIHVLAAVVWLGGGAMITGLAWRGPRGGGTAPPPQIGQQAGGAGTRGLLA